MTDGPEPPIRTLLAPVCRSFLFRCRVLFIWGFLDSFIAVSKSLWEVALI